MLFGVALIRIAALAAVYWIQLDRPCRDLAAPTPGQALWHTIAVKGGGIIYRESPLLAALGNVIIAIDRRTARREEA